MNQRKRGNKKSLPENNFFFIYLVYEVFSFLFLSVLCLVGCVVGGGGEGGGKRRGGGVRRGDLSVDVHQFR